MMTKILTTFLVVSLAASASGTMKTVIVGADWACDVRSDQPDTSFLGQAELTPWKSSEHLQFSYMRFTAPDDFDPNRCERFVVTLTRTYMGFGRLLVFVLVRPEFDDPTANGFTWNTAPGVPSPPEVKSGYIHNQVESVQIRHCGETLNGGWEGDVVEHQRDLWNQSRYILTPVVQEHGAANNTFTVFVYPSDIGTWPAYFASPANSWYSGPRLELRYEPTNILVSETGKVTQVYEGGASDSYTVVLSEAPAANVVVHIEPSQSQNLAQLELSTYTLVFTPANWAIPQSVTVAAINDAYAEPAVQRVAIRHRAESNDPAFDGSYVRDVWVNVHDNDLKFATVPAVRTSAISKSEPENPLPDTDLSPMKNGLADVVISYVQFVLPVDFKYAVDARLELVQSSIPESDDSGEIAVYVVSGKAVDGADANTFTWLSAPGHNPRSRGDREGVGLHRDYGTTASVGPIVIKNSGGVGQVVSTSQHNTAFAAELGRHAKDGTVTLMLVRNQVGGYVDTFAGINHPQYDPPKLVLNYSDAVYCGRPGQVYDMADLNRDCNVDLLDFSIMAQSWLEETVGL